MSSVDLHVLQAHRALDDAQAGLARYRRMCTLLFLGALTGVLGFMACGVAMMLWDLPGDGGIWFLGLPTLALTLACGAAFISVVVSAHEYHGSRHPALAVRTAQRTYDDALAAAVDALYEGAKEEE